MSEQLTEFQKEQAKQKLENWRKHSMTVQELYDKLGEFIKNGDGDAFIDVDDNCGGSYVMEKTMNIFVSRNNQETVGKWCYLSIF